MRRARTVSRQERWGQWGLVALLVGGCTATPVGSGASVAPRDADLAFFGAAKGTVSIRIVDERPGRQTQDFADSDNFNAAWLQLENAQRLKAPMVLTTASTGSVYTAAFTGVPSDTGANYRLGIGLFRNIANPTSVADPGYAKVANKVGYGLSGGFSVAPGSDTTVTIKINAAAPGAFYSANRAINQAAPVFPAGDTTAQFDTGINAVKDPLSDVVTLYVLDASGVSTLSTKVAPRASWPLSPQTASVSFAVPTASADYKLCVEVATGSQVLSRRYRGFGVGQASATGNSLFNLTIRFDQ